MGYNIKQGEVDMAVIRDSYYQVQKSNDESNVIVFKVVRLAEFVLNGAVLY